MPRTNDDYFWRLAAKYLAGEASEREARVLDGWIREDPTRRDLLAEAARAWERGRPRTALRLDVEAAWERLERRMEDDEAGSKPLSGTPRSERRDRPTRRGRHRVRPRAVGALTLLLVAVFAVLLWEARRETTVATERGERMTVELDDGTLVQLNVGSRLRFSDLSGRGVREVTLEGEAFFEVAHDARRPFLVRTREGVIEVVGTAFNVDAYAEDGQVSVAVAEGAVALQARSPVQSVAGDAVEDAVVLRPRQVGVMAGRRLQAVYRDVDLASHLAWREGRLVFEDAPFPEVVRRLERWYDLDLDASSLGSVDRLNAAFGPESAADVISDIALALGLRYERQGEKIRFYRRSTPQAPVSPSPTR